MTQVSLMFKPNITILQCRTEQCHLKLLMKFYSQGYEDDAMVLFNTVTAAMNIFIMTCYAVYMTIAILFFFFNKFHH